MLLSYQYYGSGRDNGVMVTAMATVAHSLFYLPFDEDFGHWLIYKLLYLRDNYVK